MLVVLAITALLMTVLFIPLTKSLELSSRGTALVTGQDNVRAISRRVTRDLQNAMEVYPPQDVQIWGYNGWSYSGRNRWQPAAGAQPESYLLRNGLIAFRMPKQQYYCTQGDHFVTQSDLATSAYAGVPAAQVALDTCPRHPGSPVELRPVSPLTPDGHVTIYFVGLNKVDNTWRTGAGLPIYQNPLLFQNSYLTGGQGNQQNTYTLYRAEFDPSLPQYAAKWQNGRMLSDFFYDTANVTGNVNGSSVTQPAWKWWADISNRVLDSETADVVRWSEAGGKMLPSSMCSFSAAPIGDEVAQPNQTPGLYSLTGGIQSGTLAPPEYVTGNGHWLSLHQTTSGGLVYDDGSTPIPDSLTLPSSVPAADPRQGLYSPHVQILDPTNNNAVVFDSLGAAASRQRMVSIDAQRGRILTSVTRRDYTAGNTNPLEWTAKLDTTDLTNISVNMADSSNGDNVKDPNGMPSSFAAAVAAGKYQPMIVPGSEVVALEDASGSQPERQPFHRAGYSLTTGDPPVSPNDLGVHDYTINYKTGRLVFSQEAAGGWAPALSASGTKVRLLISYKFQTNLPTDVVRVSYTTREMAVVNVGVVQYTRKLAEALPFEVTDRVVIRNLKR